MTGKDVPFRVVFTFFFTLLTALRVAYRLWSGTARERIFSDRAEWGLNAIWVALGIPLLFATFVFIFKPDSAPWFSIPLPGWPRWCGAGVCASGLALIISSHQSLGRRFSPTLRLRTDHTLATTGIYRWMRHPMYTGYLLLFLGAFLLSASWVIGVTGVGIIATHMTIRVNREERILTDRFGEAYASYSRSTGRFCPRIRRIRNITGRI